MTGGRRSRVTHLSKSTSVSETPVKPGKTYPLSVLDHAMALHTLHLVFYYPPAAAAGGDVVMGREKLKVSLSEVLSNYPALTGRPLRGAEDGNWTVKCNDAGVRVVDARVQGVTMKEWLRSAHESEERDLAHWEDGGDDPFIWSPFCIQITEFECGGVAIGLSCTHMYADPTCATLLVKAWGDTHRRAFIVNPPFFHPPGLCGRPNPNTVTPSAAHLASKSTSTLPPPPPPPMSTATFRFNDQTVKRCLAEIRDACPDATPFDALAALFWWRAAAHRPGPHALTVCIDFRKLMHAPLPHGFFGNSLHFSGVSSDDLVAAGWGGAAAKLSGHVGGLVEEDYWSAIDWAESRRDPATGRYGEPFRMYGPELTVANLEHMFAYGAAFGGGGKPAHVSYRVGNVEGEGLILVLPSPEVEGPMGRTVMVTLPEDQTDRISRDEVILGLGPTLLFSRSG